MAPKRTGKMLYYHPGEDQFRAPFKGLALSIKLESGDNAMRSMYFSCNRQRAIIVRRTVTRSKNDGPQNSRVI